MRLSEPGETATAVLPEALHGMGGVGKSQSVVEYIYRHVTEYDLVWWIPAEHTTQIRSSFVELAKRLGIKTGSAETAVPTVLEELRSGTSDRRWILVFDNAEHPDVVRPFIPAGSGHVVVTSRNAEWAGVARTVQVDLFTREESVKLLRRRGGGSSPMKTPIALLRRSVTSRSRSNKRRRGVHRPGCPSTNMSTSSKRTALSC